MRHLLTVVSILYVVVCGCERVSDGERTAADWVLATAGHIVVDVSGQRKSLSAGDKLPSAAFTVRSIAWDIYPGDRNSQVTDADLARFTGLSQLEQLDLWAAEITDAGVKTLLAAASLQRLQLSQTRITDEGLMLLAKLPNLRELGVVDTAVTQAAVRRFQRERPNCKVVSSGPTARSR